MLMISFQTSSLLTGGKLSERQALTQSSLLSSSTNKSMTTRLQTSKTSSLTSGLLSLKSSTSLITGTGLSQGSSLSSKSTNTALHHGASGSKQESKLLTTSSALSSRTESALLSSTKLSKPDSKKSGKVSKIKTSAKKKGTKKIKLGKYETEAPEYDFARDIPVVKEIRVPQFTPPDQDRTLLAGQKLHDVQAIKVS